jgi:hypothetical protein
MFQSRTKPICKDFQKGEFREKQNYIPFLPSRYVCKKKELCRNYDCFKCYIVQG